MTEYMTVYPDKGHEKFVVRALLDLADNPNDVQVDSRPQHGNIGFRVPAELFEQFQKTMTDNGSASESVKRKPGRPKKVEGAE